MIRQSQCCSTSSTIFSGKWSVYYSQRSSNRKIINLLRIFKLLGNMSCVKMFNFWGQKFGVLNTFAWILHSLCLSMNKRKFSVCCLHSCIGSEFSLPRYNCCAITYQTLLFNCENGFALSWDSGTKVIFNVTLEDSKSKFCTKSHHVRGYLYLVTLKRKEISNSGGWGRWVRCTSVL